MATYWNRKRSFRETGRFLVVDQHGVPHTVVQRIKTLHGVGATGLVIEAEQGISCFYSATSGDAVMLQADGSFITENGKFILRADDKAVMKTIAALYLKQEFS